MSAEYLGNYGDVDPIHTANYIARTSDGITVARVEPAPDETGHPSEEPERDGWKVTVCPFDLDEVNEANPTNRASGPWETADVGGVLEGRGWDPDTLERENRDAWPEGYAKDRDPILALAVLDYHGAYHLNATTYERDTLAEAMELVAGEFGVSLDEMGVSK